MTSLVPHIRTQYLRQHPKQVVDILGMLSVLLSLTLFCSTLAASKSVAAQEAWPVINTPKDISLFEVGEQMTANGLTMRLQGFISKTSADNLIVWFRNNMGQPIVENTLGRKHILGRSQGNYYLTVQIEATRQGSQGILAVTDLRSPQQNQQATMASKQRWLNRLPAGSKIISQLSSAEGAKINSQLIITNRHNERLNRDALHNILRNDGFELKRESNDRPKPSTRLPNNLRNSQVMVFSGKDKEAIVTIQRSASGETFMVLNTVTQVEKFK